MIVVEPLTHTSGKRLHRIVAALVLTVLGLAQGAAAQDEPSAAASQLTPYVWGAGVGGSIRPLSGGPTIEFDESFSDLLENLDAAFFVSGYTRIRRFVALGDFSYASSSRDGIAALPVIGLAPAEGSLRQNAFTLVAGYRMVAAPRVSVDALGGFRAWWLRGEVDVAGGVLSRSSSVSFADPIAAVRANVAFTSRWSVILYTDVGGFGAGSELTTQFLGTVNVRLATHLYLSGGFRYLSVDYDQEQMRIDASMAGPLAGATWRF